MTKPLTCNDMRKVCQEFFNTADGSERAKFWDVITALRGPDSPSERPNMTPEESSKAYQGRRERKYKTVEVIRSKAFYGACGGSARRRDGESVLLPPTECWEHFDKHVAKAAAVLGLKVEVEK